MIGSHNSMSYLPIRGWRKILTPWARCQSISLQQQYELGVRYFDIRIRKIGSDWHFVHNNTDLGLYKDHIEEILLLSMRPDTWFRFILDERKTPPHPVEYKADFFKTTQLLLDRHVNIDSLIVFWEWKEYQKNKTIRQLEYHTSVISPWYTYILGTKWFAKTHNSKAEDDCRWTVQSNTDVLLLDYVQY